jgi:hypothetical protein
MSANIGRTGFSRKEREALGCAAMVALDVVDGKSVPQDWVRLLAMAYRQLLEFTFSMHRTHETLALLPVTVERPDDLAAQLELIKKDPP